MNGKSIRCLHSSHKENISERARVRPVTHHGLSAKFIIHLKRRKPASNVEFSQEEIHLVVRRNLVKLLRGYFHAPSVVVHGLSLANSPWYFKAAAL